MHTLTINANALRYVLPHVSTEESRPSIRGVYVAPDGTIAASNGATVAVHRNAATTDAPALIRFHKPATVTARKVHQVLVQWDNPGDSYTVTLLDDVGRTIGATLADVLPEEFPTLSGIFAGWAERIDAGGVPLGVIGFNPALLALFDVSTTRGEINPIELFLHSDSRGALVRWHRNPDALGLVMPCRVPADNRDAAREIAAQIAGEPTPVPAGV